MYNSQMVKERIKTICKDKKVNMESMLIDCSLGVNAIRQINDTKGIASFSLAKIADYLECSVDYLLGRTDIPEVNRGIVDEDYEYDRPIPYIAAYSGDVAYDGESIPLEDIKELNESEDEA